MRQSKVVELQRWRVRQQACRMLEIEMGLGASVVDEDRAKLVCRRALKIARIEREARLRPRGDALRRALLHVLDAYDRLWGHTDARAEHRAAIAYARALTRLAQVDTCAPLETRSIASTSTDGCDRADR